MSNPLTVPRIGLSQSESKTLKKIDHIPVLSMITGVGRTAFGASQLGISILALFGSVGTCKCQLDQFFWIKGLDLMGEGLANVTRGVVAVVPFVGNLALYKYDEKVQMNDYNIVMKRLTPEQLEQIRNAQEERLYLFSEAILSKLPNVSLEDMKPLDFPRENSFFDPVFTI